MRALLILSLVAAPLLTVACRATRPERPDRERQVFTLTHLDAQPLPTAFADPRGAHTLHGGRLVLAPNGEMWLVLHLSAPGAGADSAGKYVLSEEYRWAASDSLEFPFYRDEPNVHAAEFFGRRVGRALTLRARPPTTPTSISLAAQFGGAHVWEFRQDSGFVR